MSSRRRIVVSALIGLLAVFGVSTERWFVHPTVDDPGTADAVFVLGGGGDRVEFAVDLARSGVSTEIVFASVFVESENVWAARPCNSVRPSNVPEDTSFRCVEPDPRTTQGEARLLRDLATEEGWEEVVVVASIDQITRARRLIGRCWDGEVRLTGPNHSDPWPIRAAYEWGAGLKATILRDC